MLAHERLEIELSIAQVVGKRAHHDKAGPFDHDSEQVRGVFTRVEDGDDLRLRGHQNSRVNRRFCHDRRARQTLRSLLDGPLQQARRSLELLEDRCQLTRLASHFGGELPDRLCGPPPPHHCHRTPDAANEQNLSLDFAGAAQQELCLGQHVEHGYIEKARPVVQFEMFRQRRRISLSLSPHRSSARSATLASGIL
jgi:hypothetical protein